MTSGKKQNTNPAKATRKSRAEEVANTFEWLITAFVLAFLFRAFVMEAFRIPTGSMADTLKGAHFRLRCTQCGYKYDYGLGNYGLPRDTAPRGYLKKMSSRCPSCGYDQPTGGEMPVAGGDRILVLKCVYQFFEPKQWDVVVFKNPPDPTVNYIKRLVGRPGETIEIIDGDVYIDGQISRKPPKVQEELWMPVYDNDYQPVRPREALFYGRSPWEQPFKNLAGSEWEIDKADPTKFRLESSSNQISTMIYDTTVGNSFRATYAYDNVRNYPYMPYCSDLMARFYVLTDEAAAGGEEYVRSESRPQGRIGISLSKYQTNYRAWYDFSGEIVMSAVSEGKETILRRESYELPVTDVPLRVTFANVDHQLVFRLGSKILTYDLGRNPDDVGPRRTDIQPEVQIFGCGKLMLSNVAIFRDIHYTARKFANSSETGRATEGNPLKLKRDEFFVLGDNSPNSEDSRWWDRPGKRYDGTPYREGIVPRDYLVGKALFVYWPSGFRPYAGFPIGIIPNVGQRFIYGGSGKTP
ncbi:MAG: signal peptidase I [Planctomycetota bacterium]|jgi:signal peptidase I